MLGNYSTTELNPSLCFETLSQYIAQVGLKSMIFYLNLWSVGIISMYYHSWLIEKKRKSFTLDLRQG